MYAVVVTGGKQYRVMQGETLRVELLDAEPGSEINLDNILMLGDGEGVSLGDALKGASVTAKVIGHGRADKIRIVKFASRWVTGSTTPKSRSPGSPIPATSKEKPPWHIKKA
jgi:large subunit ribosomal protein L21